MGYGIKKGDQSVIMLTFYSPFSVSVPRTRLELAQPFDHYHLKVACIPISPPGRYPVPEIGLEPTRP